MGDVVGSIVGGVLGSDAAEEQGDAARYAASQSSAASKYATDLQREMWEMQRRDYSPWRQTGTGAINQLARLMGVESAPLSFNDWLEANYSDDPEVTGKPKVTYALNDQDTNARIQQLIQQAANEPLMYNTGGQFDPVAMALYEAGLPKAKLDTSEEERVALRKQQYQQYLADMQKQDQAADFGLLARNFGMQDFEADPGYAFRLSEGQKAIERSAAARGGLQSGSALKAAARFGQDMGSQEYQNAFNRYQVNQSNRFNRLASLAGVGQTAVGALGAAGQNYANAAGNIAMQNAANQGNAMLSAGQARASSYGGIGNALGSISGQLGNIFSSSPASASSYSPWDTGSATWSGSSPTF